MAAKSAAEPDDMTSVWACAINLRLYDSDPGPRQVDVGSDLEARVVDRREALIDLYARTLLEELDADTPRLEAVEAESRRRASKGSTFIASVVLVMRRLKSPRKANLWRSSLEVFTKRDRQKRCDAWLTAAAIASEARRMVVEAGAEDNEKNRTKLLAATQFSLSRDVLGDLIPLKVRKREAQDLIERLNEVDLSADSD